MEAHSTQTLSPVGGIRDNDQAVTNAALELLGVLSERRSLEELCEEMIDIAPFAGRQMARPVRGATCIDQVDCIGGHLARVMRNPNH